MINTPSQDTFYLGLCLGGTNSAGAYSAGVMDYLFEALEEWEKRRGLPGVPSHRVEIPVIGGTSAGGMVGIIGAAALNNPLQHIDKPTEIFTEHPENKLYHSLVDLTSEDMLSKVLDISDIKPSLVKSIFNSNFLDALASRSLSVDVTKWQPLPSFINQKLKVFSTLTNLKGFNYPAGFLNSESHNNEFYRTQYIDFACFELTEDENLGSNNGWIPLNLRNGINIDVATQALLATGAFPIGLESRILNRPIEYINANPWLKNNLQYGTQSTTLNVDGGFANNDLFERVRDVLNDSSQQPTQNHDDFTRFNSTILMVEPFQTTNPAIASGSQSLLNVANLTFSSLLSQRRSKTKYFEAAMDENRAGQYLINPSRTIVNVSGEKVRVTGELAITCGTIGGFGGFLSKEFRVHDYFLGRHNCKIFLRDYFTIPSYALANNPIFAKGYDGIDTSKFKSKIDDGYQIIPVVNDTTDYTFLDFKFKSGSNWPVIDSANINSYNTKIKSRVNAVLSNLPDNPSFLTKSLLWFGGHMVWNNLFSKKLISMIKTDLRDRDLMDNTFADKWR